MFNASGPPADRWDNEASEVIPLYHHRPRSEVSFVFKFLKFILFLHKFGLEK